MKNYTSRIKKNYLKILLDFLDEVSVTEKDKDKAYKIALNKLIEVLKADGLFYPPKAEERATFDSSVNVVQPPPAPAVKSRYSMRKAL